MGMMALWQEQQVVELTSASALQPDTELKHFESWNSPCLEIDYQFMERRGGVVVQDRAFLTQRRQPAESLELTAAPELLCREYIA